MKTFISAVIVLVIPIICSAVGVPSTILTREFNSTVLETFLDELKSDCIRSSTPVSKLSAVESAFLEFLNSSLWSQLEQDRGIPKSRAIVESRLHSQFEHVLAIAYDVQRNVYPALYGPWAAAHFATVPKNILNWNSDHKNWTIVPNSTGGNVQRQFLERLLVCKIQILYLKSIVDQIGANDQILAQLVDEANRISTSSLWIQFWNPNKQTAANTANSMDQMLSHLDGSIQSLWLELHPNLANVFDKTRSDLAMLTRIAEMNQNAFDEANAAALETQRRIADLQEQHRRELANLEAQNAVELQDLRRDIRNLKNRIDY